MESVQAVIVECCTLVVAAKDEEMEISGVVAAMMGVAVDTRVNMKTGMDRMLNMLDFAE